MSIQQAKLIGYPAAGRASVFPVKVQGSIYSLIAAGVWGGSVGGDITGGQSRAGAGMGAGHGSATLYRVGKDGKRKVVSRRKGTKGKAKHATATGARAVGGGVDPALARVLAVEHWLAPCVEVNFEQVLDADKARARAAIMAAIASEQTLPGRVYAVAKRAAARQARRLVDLRGVYPSRTSIEDAASDAVCGLLSSVRKLDKLTAAQWQSRRVAGVLAMYAGRAAFRSLASWSVAGMTGDNTHTGRDQRQYLASVEGAKLGAVLPNGLLLTGATVWESDKRARVAFVRWVYGVGFFPVKASATGQGSAWAVKSALARCQVVARVPNPHVRTARVMLPGFWERMRGGGRSLAEVIEHGGRGFSEPRCSF